VKVIGSFLLRTMALPRATVDLGVEMPAACFTDRDFKNYVYADKRALYLGVLAKKLAESPLVKSVAFDGFCLDADKPVLVLTPGVCSCERDCACSRALLQPLFRG
jgi:hypothetical protein